METYDISMEYIYSTTLKRGKAVVILSKSYGGRTIVPGLDSCRPGDMIEIFGDKYIVKNTYSEYTPYSDMRDYYLESYLDKEADEMLRLWTWSGIAVDVSVGTTDSCNLERTSGKYWIRIK